MHLHGTSQLQRYVNSTRLAPSLFFKEGLIRS